MSVKAKRHIHKYRKVEFNGSKVWKCGLPDCPHYMPKHLEVMVEGKYSFCWNCSKQIVLAPENMSMDEPWCYDCISNGGKIPEHSEVMIPMGFDITDIIGHK